MSGSLGKVLLDWYREHARELPWRGERDPYRILVSEVMLQQTRVETVQPYYQRWIERFPTLADLAEANLEEVLQLWEGLGYYRRAHNLHRAAQLIQQEHSGQIPGEPRRLRELPGIGEYTAAAVAALAFDEDQVALDGNLKRVLARLFGVSDPIDQAAVVRDLKQRAEAMMPEGQAADFNQALMDLGAMICTPANPACSRCPLSFGCQAYQTGTQAEIPRRNPRSAPRLVDRTALVIEKAERVLMGQRPPTGLLSSLWEFPRFESNGEAGVRAARAAAWAAGCLGVQVKIGPELGRFTHTYTHFKVREQAFRCRWQAGEPHSDQHQAVQWVTSAELDDLPMGKLSRTQADAWQRSVQRRNPG